MAYAANFVRNDSAKALAAAHVRNIVGRQNTVTGRPYSQSPAIMAPADSQRTAPLRP